MVPQPTLVWASYEVGPTGDNLRRLLVSLRAHRELIGLSMTAKARRKVKTDERACGRLARLHRAGDWPSGCQLGHGGGCAGSLPCAGDTVKDFTRRSDRLSKFLMRHSNPAGRTELDGQARGVALAERSRRTGVTEHI
jgi:hypothetical protein